MDREKVIRELKYLRDKETWREGIMIHDDHARVRKQIASDALELLKEQRMDIEALKKAYTELAEKGQLIVRCKDCKKQGSYDCHITSLTGQTSSDDWFCADGELR